MAFGCVLYGGISWTGESHWNCEGMGLCEGCRGIDMTYPVTILKGQGLWKDRGDLWVSDS